MNRTLIALGATAVLTVGMTGAAFAADRYASPSQPVPYSQLNTYMKVSASKRAAILAKNTDAMPAADAGVNSSATTPASQPMPTAGAATSNGQTSMPMTAPTTTPVNPPADVATPPTSPSSPTPQ